MGTITANICNKKVCAIEITTASGISTGGNVVTAEIMPLVVCSNGNTVVAEILPVNSSPYCDVVSDASMEWYRASYQTKYEVTERQWTGSTVVDTDPTSETYGQIIESPQYEDVVIQEAEYSLLDYITVKCKNPVHCHWNRTFLRVYGDNVGLFRDIGDQIQVGHAAREIPDDGNDLWAEETEYTYFNINTILVAPGERIVMVYEFFDGTNMYQVEAASAWFCTCCLSGGRIVSVNGEYGSTDLTYTMSIYGAEYTATSSDFTEYREGDWVFVLTDGGACSNCHRTTVCADGSCSMSGNPLIVPIRIGFFGVLEEYANYAIHISSTDMGALLDLCVQRGVIIEVDGAQQTASIEVDE